LNGEVLLFCEGIDESMLSMNYVTMNETTNAKLVNGKKKRKEEWRFFFGGRGEDINTKREWYEEARILGVGFE